MRAWPGQPYPLSTTWTGFGVNFALFTAHATRVELCLFDGVGATATSATVDLAEHTGLVWHGFLADARSGQLYGYRMYGPWDPRAGHRFNLHKVLFDPYAKAVARVVCWDDTMFGYLLRGNYLQGRPIRGAGIKDICSCPGSGRSAVPESVPRTRGQGR